MASDAPMDSQFIVSLLHAFNDMNSAKMAVQDAIRADQNDYGVFVPNYGETQDDTHSLSAREAAMLSLTQFYKGSGHVEAGLLCASDATVQTIHAFNAAKQMFKKAVMAIRDAYEPGAALPSRYISNLISQHAEEHGFRGDALKHALKTIGVSELNLKKCYAEIRILPKDLDVFCWTWATQHSRIKKLNLEQVTDKINAYFDGNPDAIEINLRRLSECDPGEELALRVRLKNQLRANYGYKVDGQIVRKSCPISGVVIVQGTTLPRYVWRDDPDVTGFNPPKVPRVSTIESEPFIQQLDLYRYVR